MSTVQMPVKDQTMPEGKWKFDDEVTRVFDDMLARSIPQHEVMREAVTELAGRFVREKTDVVDLGCSRGESLAPLLSRFGAHNRFVGVEISEPMLAACRVRFKSYIECGVVDIRKLDLRHDYPAVRASVTLSVLTLQFVPIEYRQNIIHRVFEHTAPGGAFVLVEKVLGSGAKMDETFVESYYALKRRNGYTQEAIDRKRLALEGVLVPVTGPFNEQMLISGGFRHIDCFWRWMNFAGWLALKE